MVHGKRTFVCFLIIIALPVLLMHCGGETAGPAGTWRAVLESKGGELPFSIVVESNTDGTLSGVVVNGEERLSFTTVDVRGDSIFFVFEHYDSILKGALSAGGKKIDGVWSRRSMGGRRTTMDFAAQQEERYRFSLAGGASAPAGVLTNISGEWSAWFGDNPASHSTAVFNQEKSGRVTGTFLTTTGDYRFLEGTYESGRLQLSVFDGAHAFLFRASVDPQGVMRGRFWSRNGNPVDWTAEKGAAAMPDPYELTKLTNDRKRFRFSFPDVDGNTVSNRDDRFRGKALLVYIFGTWCPNCNDEARLLAELYREYHKRGLEIVGLANEYTGDFAQDSEMVKRFMERYGIDWPMLVVGVANKRTTQKLLPDLDRVLSYPTTVFIDRTGTVGKIHTGFTGPGTGEYYTKLVREFRENIEEILK